MAATSLRRVQTTRYAVPLREGGSLPAIMEADDCGLYVVKFRGAGQGVAALVAEIVAGEIGRALGLNVPEMVLAEVDAALGRNEPDAEIRYLLKQSHGLNLGLDYLPGSTMFDCAAGDAVSAEVASLAVWFDAYVQNVDRTVRNPNLLLWHRRPWFIDHGAALYFHHNWATAEQKAEAPLAEIRSHVLLPWATDLAAAGATAKSKLTETVLREILEMVPAEWLDGEESAETRRQRYVAYLLRRLAASDTLQEEAERARLLLI